MTMNYEDIKSPSDLKRLNIGDLKGLCKYLRSRIIDTVQQNGGHLSSNLGVVELTVALHYVFDCPKDKIIFDVGHQCYAHKLLTERGDKFDGLRKNDGISGFPQPRESEYDAFIAGHASTSLSVALGIAQGAKYNNLDINTVAVIGDGAFSGGMAFEALNSIGSECAPVITVLNDNGMSISKNVGAVSNYLTRLRISKRYIHAKTEIKRAVSIIPFFGDGAIRLLDKGKRFIKRLVLSDKMFEAMGIGYYGPFDGHNIKELIEVFENAKTKRVPVLIHVLTDKGCGLPSATIDPEHFHGVDGCTAKGCEKSFSSILGDFLLNAAQHDKSIVAITAAMSIGTGLEGFSRAFPDRFKDVGISEEHAVTYSAAMASVGIKPYFAVYSTFLQRGFDQILHDVCIGNYAVRLCVDRAGIVGSDGVTHQGVFDIGYLTMLPNMTVMCPMDGNEFVDMLQFSLSFNAPLAIRYPKSYSLNTEHAPIEYGKWELLSKCSSNKVYLLCVGPRAYSAVNDIKGVNIVNCRFVKPLDSDFLDRINKTGNVIITVEDNVRRGGFGESVLSYLSNKGINAKVQIVAHADKFIDNRDIDQSLMESGICKESITELIKNLNYKQK